ncbi:hypothetical protein PVAND_014604 [Polypedilum vanderplanki]|uniref:Uncharacterized protein n=1 Tax=Polypedilum vanderplanki TaxID=319348 RepID=A0A9J6BA55_POLVA|nr:hypothetical protein PVAND_014604 [Polypedilum vanderplanki]
MKILLLIFFTIFICVSSSKIKNLDKKLILLINKKFLNVNDSFLDDEYFKFDTPFLRSVDENCVFNRLNLINTNDVKFDEIKNFDANFAFGELDFDYNILVVYIMYSCIENVEDFVRQYFEKAINDAPIFYIPKDSTECVKDELIKINKEKPMIVNFIGLKNHTEEQCDEILFDMKEACKSQDEDFRGCLQIYDEHSLEYFLKFTIMRNEKIGRSCLDGTKVFGQENFWLNFT